MVEVKHVDRGSIAEDLGIRIGDKVISVNGKEIRDALDFRFYSAGEFLELVVERQQEQIVYEIEKDFEENLGIELQDLLMRSCGNRCIFCFVFQNPKGLRKSLYFKDEDYRFSFLFGHYVTLTNSTQEDLDRIVEQRLSPLYVSVHATEPDLRRLLLGIRFEDHLLEKIDFLTRHGIQLNCQIVLCPGINDGLHLDRTIEDLKTFFPGVRSVAIVPVGLTRYRKNLYPIKPVTTDYCQRMIREVNVRRRKLKKELGSSFVYLSDEFYIRTGTPIPGNAYYEGFYQLENGVGLTRDFLNRFKKELLHLRAHQEGLTISLITGLLGARVFERYLLNSLSKVPGLQFKLHAVVNHFYGPDITVSGLLVGEDIYQALRSQELGKVVVLPPRCLNDEGLFLDNWTVEQLQQKLKRKILVFPGNFRKLFLQIEKHETAHSYNCW